MSQRLLAPCRFEQVLKRSRFIAQAIPVGSEAETLEVYQAVADPAATHNCWAWRIDGRHRFNDDGEPGGTAGRPILAAIEGRDLDKVMIVVTRHYGGIMLGAGGLARAYGGTAAKCLDRAETERRIPMLDCEVTADFSLSDSIHRLLERHGALKTAERYGEKGLRLDLQVPRDEVEPLRRALVEISRGEAKLWISR